MQDALLNIRILDNTGQKRYAVYGLSEDDFGNQLLTFSGGHGYRAFAEIFESHPISFLFFHFATRFWSPDLEEWLLSAFLASDVREQFDNSVFDGKVVEFRNPGETTVTLLDLV